MNFVSAAMIDSTPEYESWRRQFLQDLFHKLSQPLTALNCTLELALRKPTSASEYREAMEQALALTGLLIGLIKAERESAESTDPGDMRPFDLVSLVRTVLDDLNPIFDDSGISLILSCQENPTLRADPDRMSRALFSLVHWSVQNNRSLHRQLLLWIGNVGAEVTLYLGPTVSETTVAGDKAAYLPIAAPHSVIVNILKAAGGRLQILHSSKATKALLKFPAHQPAQTYRQAQTQTSVNK